MYNTYIRYFYIMITILNTFNAIVVYIFLRRIKLWMAKYMYSQEKTQ